jgi:hypothetical protein
MDYSTFKLQIGVMLYWHTSQYGLGTSETISRTSTEMHEFIRETVRKAYGDIAEDVSIFMEEVKNQKMQKKFSLKRM